MRLTEVRKNVWKVVVYVGIDPTTGKQRQRSKTFEAHGKLADVRKVARKHVTTIEGETAATHERRQTVNGLVDEWSRVRDAADSPNTVRGRSTIMKRIRAGLGNVALDELSARHVDQWMTGMRLAGLSDTSIANHHSALRAILNQGDLWDMVTARATHKAKPPRKNMRRKPKPPTGAALDVLVAEASPDLQVCAEISAETGMRRGEIVALQWTDVAGGAVNVQRAMVDLPGDAWRTKAPKSGQPREIPVSDEFLALLERHHARQRVIAEQAGVELDPAAWVIADLMKDPTGRRPRRAGWLTLAWLRHRKRLGTDATFHDLRHWSATELIDAGVPLPVVQKRLGHLQLSTTVNVYAHSVSASEQEAARVISRRRGRSETPELATPQ